MQLVQPKLLLSRYTDIYLDAENNTYHEVSDLIYMVLFDIISIKTSLNPN